MPQLRAGGSEGKGGQVPGLRGGRGLPKQKECKKDLRGMREGVESRCQQLQPKSKMKLNQLSIGTVFFFIGETTTAFKAPAGGDAGWNDGDGDCADGGEYDVHGLLRKWIATPIAMPATQTQMTISE